MGALRILLLATAILVICLILLPKTAKEKTLERLSLKVTILICSFLIVIFSIALYLFRDTLWTNPENVSLLTKKVQLDEDNNKFLVLTNYNLHNISAESLIKLIEQHKDLNSLRLKNIDLNNAHKIKQLLHQNKQQITTLTLHQIEPKTVSIIFAALSENESIQTFTINEQNLSPQQLKLLVASLENNTKLKTLELTYARLNDDDLLTIGELFNLKTLTLENLSLRGNLISDAGAKLIAKAIENNNNLVSLDLWGNNIGNSGATALAKGLSNNYTLQNLSLGYNKVEDQGIAELAKALRKNKTLLNLGLTRNPFTNEGATALINSLQQNQTLKTLKVHAEGISKENLKKLFEYRD